MSEKRRITAGNIQIGGGARVTVQSMLNTPPGDADAAVAQAKRLEAAGCDIIRLAVSDEADAACIRQLKQAVQMPVVADIQFDYRMALLAIEAGVDKVRLNPGNLRRPEHVRAVVEASRERHIPIRVGVNAGSISREILEQFGGPCADALVEEAFRHIRILEDMDFHDIVVSLKASGVPMMLEGYRKMDKLCEYPLHLGVTEAGTKYDGMIKSAVGIGALLSEGIGDTVRVSLTADPVEEIKAARAILRALGLLSGGPELVSCPTCSRCSVDLIRIADEVRTRLDSVHKDIKVAVMGCVVNGPGEARDADIGITGAQGEGLIFRKGEIIGRVPEAQIVDELFRLIEEL